MSEKATYKHVFTFRLGAEVQLKTQQHFHGVHLQLQDIRKDIWGERPRIGFRDAALQFRKV